MSSYFDLSGIGEGEWYMFHRAEWGWSEIIRPKRLRDWLRLLLRGWRFHAIITGRWFLTKKRMEKRDRLN